MPGKLGLKSDKCFFIGYPRETKGYYFYHRSVNKVFAIRHGVFLKKEFLSKEYSGSKITLEEIQDPLSDISGQAEVEQVLREVVEQVQQAPHVKRSDRIVYAPERYLGLHEILLIGDIDPLTYHEAMSREDFEEWFETMKFEL
jgi:hypothetical protein